jgi:hypothetical protein
MDQSSGVHFGAHNEQIHWPLEPWPEGFWDLLSSLFDVYFGAHTGCFEWRLLKTYVLNLYCSEAMVLHLWWALEVNMSALKQTSASST